MTTGVPTAQELRRPVELERVGAPDYHDAPNDPGVYTGPTAVSDEDGIGGGRSTDNIRRVGLDEDIPWCARRSVLDVVSKVVGRTQTTVEIGR